MAATKSRLEDVYGVERIDLLYQEVTTEFDEILQMLHIVRVKDPLNFANASLALVESVYYKNSRNCINWDKIQKFWCMEDDPPLLSDADFSKLQTTCMRIRSSCDYVANSIKSYCPKDELENWLNNRDGYSKILNMFIISFPFMVISVYTREFRKIELEWSHLLEYGNKGRIYMFDVMSDMCQRKDVDFEKVLRTEDKLAAFNIIKTNMDAAIITT